MMDKTDVMDQIVIDIYNYNVDDINNIIYNLIVYVEQSVKLKGTENTDEFNMILNGILKCMENRDYLMLSDIIQFKLKPFIL